jgi:hypothetical protein
MRIIRRRKIKPAASSYDASYDASYDMELEEELEHRAREARIPGW